MPGLHLGRRDGEEAPQVMSAQSHKAMSAHLDPWSAGSQVRTVTSRDSFVEEVGLERGLEGSPAHSPWKKLHVFPEPELPHLPHTCRLPCPPVRMCWPSAGCARRS